MNKKLSVIATVVFAFVVVSGIYLSEPARNQDKAALAPEELVPVDQVQMSAKEVKTLKAKTSNWSEKKKRMRGVIPKDRPDLFAKWHNGIRTRDGETVPSYTMNYQVEELLEARGVASTKELAELKGGPTLNWQERGPGNVAGRTRSILIYPGDPNYDTWIVGSVGGGVWKTTDAGQTWTHLTEGLGNLATSTLAQSAANPNIIYAGTGEGFGNVDQIDGSGIWKSTDAGATWNQLASTATNPEFENVMRMVADPADPNTVVAAVATGFNSVSSSGIYRTTDGGTSWTKTYDSPSTDVQQIIANPLNFNTQYAALDGSGVIKSLDGGQTWSDASNGIGGIGRLELAIAPSDTNVVYFSAQGGPSGSILYSSTDAGANWFAHNDATGTNRHWLLGQGWYDNAIAVNPYDANEIYVGGVDIMKLNVVAGSDTSEPDVTGIDDTTPFLSGVNWGGPYYFGTLGTGDDFYTFSPTGGAVAVTGDDFTSVEMRFGPGESQMAHRFLRNDSTGVYEYQDYIEVPFTMWDVDNNVQIMCSFRDWADDSTFDLVEFDGANLQREYLTWQAIPYSSTPDDSVAKSWGVTYKNIFTMWPILASGATWDPNNLPASAFTIHWGTTTTKRLMTTVISDGRNQYGVGPKGVHVDHHNLTLVKTNEATQSFRLINGNDGGIAYSDDKGGSFSQTGDTFGAGMRGYNTTQFYGVDKANGVDRYIGGMQDNGSWFSGVNPDETSVWTTSPGGDGFEAVWHYGKVNYMMESSQFNSIFRSLDGGMNWESVSPPEQNGDPFFTKIAKSKQDPDLVFAIGGSGVWRSENFANSWTLTQMTDPGWNGTSSFSQIKIHLHNPQIIWTGQSMSVGSPLYISTDGGLTFSAANVFTDVTMGRTSGIETHPSEDNTAFALFSFRGAPKILKTSDLGQTWSDISGFGTNATSSAGFPDVAVFSLLVMPFNTNMIWAGTEIGIFETTNGGASWAFADNGFPATAVYEMLIVNDEVVVATHGRGVWTVALPELAEYEPPATMLAPRFAQLGGGGNGIITADVRLPSPYDSSFIWVDGEKAISFDANEAAADTTVEFTVVFEGDRDTVSVSITSYVGGATLSNAAQDVEVFTLSAARAFYATDFNDANDDLIFTTGMQIDTPAGFTDGAIHSDHPYADDRDYIASLKFPIIVSSDNSMITFDEIAIVEPGEPGSQFGDDDFWDFVVVEGSNDNGATWLPLADGYDARADQAWLTAYDAGAAGDPSMYVTRTLDLTNAFAVNDEVLIRFRLLADANTNGWGWAIDNLVIQTEPVSVESSGEQLPTEFALIQNYPNPFNPTTQINYALPQSGEVSLQIFNVLGQRVRDLVRNQKQDAGRYSVEWDGNNDFGQPVSSGIYVYRINVGDFTKSFKMTLLK